MKIKIRKAKKDDWKEISDIYFEASIDEVKLQFPERTKSSIIKEVNKWKEDRIKEFKKDVNSKNNCYLVAEINREIIGFANAKIDKNKEGKFTMLYIKKEFQGKGIGKKLIKERLKWTKSKKIKIIEAGSYIKNKCSISNLKKFGFTPVTIVMRREL
ncbi:MAG: GNAT family N-acetyltransferase [Candidatus Pacearchaeota archaeon]|jgi:ribosomal protein S18 acetylase RimI-like enzyme